MIVKLSPVKQKMKDDLSLSSEEFILIVGGNGRDGFYKNFLPNNPKASRVDTVVASVRFLIKKYGRGRTFAGISTWLEAIESKRINPKLPADRSKLKFPYVEGIVKNTRDEFIASAKNLNAEKCGLCGSILVNGRCPTCG